MLYWRHDDSHLGHTQFAVERSGVVLLAVIPRWGGGGSRQHSWRDKVTSRKALLPMAGAKRVKSRIAAWGWCGRLLAQGFRAGDTFDLRTEKYRAADRDPSQVVMAHD